jgi:hypothetical protein
VAAQPRAQWQLRLPHVGSGARRHGCRRGGHAGSREQGGSGAHQWDSSAQPETARDGLTTHASGGPTAVAARWRGTDGSRWRGLQCTHEGKGRKEAEVGKELGRSIVR